MIFYQFTTNIVTTEQLKDSIFKGNSNHIIQHFDLCNSYGNHTIDDFLCIVESKRETLGNPDGHAFLSLELLPEPTLDMNKLIDLAEQVADAINRYYDYDLYIASLIYDDDDNCRRTVILISDMEKSLSSSSTTTVLSDSLEEILLEALPEYTLEPITYHALYLFNSDSKDTLPYDGVIHLQCPIQKL